MCVSTDISQARSTGLGALERRWAASLKTSLPFALELWSLLPNTDAASHRLEANELHVRIGGEAGRDTSGETDGPFDCSPPLRTHWTVGGMRGRHQVGGLGGRQGANSRAPLGGAEAAPLRTGGWEAPSWE